MTKIDFALIAMIALSIAVFAESILYRRVIKRISLLYEKYKKLEEMQQVLESQIYRRSMYFSSTSSDSQHFS